MFDINVFNNGDHACVAWRPSGDPKSWAPIPDCRGFAIQRRLTRGTKTTDAWVHNRIGFAPHAPQPPAGQEWQWPIQRYLWWDYEVQLGDTVSYRVFSVTGTAAALQAPDTSGDGGWTKPQTVSATFGDTISAWFNRGVIATQWVERALAKIPGTQGARGKLLDAIATPNNPLREALGGSLKPALLDLLAKAKGSKIYAALYELNDFEVKAALVAIGKDCNLILGNGAFKPGELDENAAVRAEIRDQVTLSDRLVKSGHFAHNKFILFCDAAGNPEKVWTGSTNLTLTGLCTQANNGILIEDKAVAQDYYDAWCRLKAAGNAYPSALIKGNSTATERKVGDATTVKPWFAATDAAEDLTDARARITAAKEGILFLFFNPGKLSHEPLKETLLQNVLERNAKGDLYVRGVVNQEIAGLTDTGGAAAKVDADAQTQSPVTLVQTGQDSSRLSKSVLVPAAITAAYGDWEAELKGASSVMIHSKVIVIDPFGDTPVVMTGSHNMGYKASSANDDNLNIIVGNGPLAQAYAANIVAIFQEYRWRDYVATHRDGGWKGLEDNDTWQAGHLARDAQEMMFWVP